MSSILCARDAIAESLHYEALAVTYRLIATEAFHALHAAKQREDSLAEQCAALRLELRAARCATWAFVQKDACMARLRGGI